MQTASVAVPTTIGAFSTLVDASFMDPLSCTCKLGAGLTRFDTFQLYGTLDPSATGASPNIVPLGIVRGNQGGFSFEPVSLCMYPLFMIQRLTGNNTGNFFASGTSAPNGPSTVIGASLPAIGAFSAHVDLRYFMGPILLGLDAAQTAFDVFNVYGTDDSTVTSTDGATFLGTIQGGGGLTNTTLLVEDYSFVLVARVSGLTSGFTFASGRIDANRGGSAIVPDQTASGNITPDQNPPSIGTAQQLVDENYIVQVQQFTAGIDLTLATPSAPFLPMTRVVVNVGTTVFTFYGKRVEPPTVGSGQNSAAIAVWAAGAPAWVLAGNA